MRLFKKNKKNTSQNDHTSNAFTLPKNRRFKRLSKHSLLVGVIVLGVLLVVTGGSYALYLAASSGPSSSNQSTSINLGKGLVGWWRMQGNPNDWTPYRDNGTLNGSPLPSLTTDQNGTANSAYSFNGTNDYILANNNSAMNSTTGATVAVWFQTSSINASYVKLIGKGPDASEQWSIYLTPTNRYCHSEDQINSAQHTFSGNSNLADGKWHLCVYTYDGTTQRIYVDGSQQSSVALTGTISTNSENVSIGAEKSSSTSQYYFNGSIGETRVYNRALSAAEVTALYKQYAPSLNSAAGENGLVGWWKMQGNATDSSPYRDNATVNGATLTTDRNGAANSAYSFNGTSNYLGVASPSHLSFTGPVTQAAWIKPSNVGTDQVIMDGYIQYNLQIGADGSGSVHLADGNGNGCHTGTGVIATNIWYHIVAVYSGTSGSTVTTSNCMIYVNGVQQTVTTFGTTWSPSASTTNFDIGSYNNGAGLFYSGSMNDVRVYSRALSSTEIKNLYNSYNSQIEVGGSGTSGSVSLGSGLVGYWPLDGNAKDSTPNRNNGTVSGATLTTDRLGRANSAYSFNGTSNYINAATLSSLSTGKVTVAGWVDCLGSTGSRETMASIGENTSTGTVLAVDDGTGNVSFWVHTSGFVAVTTPTVYNQWQYIVGTYDGATIKLYVNGVLKNSVTTSGAMTTPTSQTTFGTRNSDALHWLKGSLNDMRVYNRALSQAEVIALYNEYQ